MYAWQEIQVTLDYIEENYDKEIDIDKLAAIAHLSKYYYQRLFFRLTKKTVNDYVKLRRLEKAANQLKNTEKRILDIAIACGFSGHSAFTRAFKEVYKITPDDYRNQKIHLDHFIKPDLQLNYVVIDTGVPLIVEEMVLEINEKQVCNDRIFYGNSKMAKVDELGEPKINNIVSLYQELDVQDAVVVDILTLSDDPALFNYFVGIEIDRPSIDCEQRIIPSGKYVVCSYEAENFESLVNEALYKASRYLYEVWFVEHRLEPDDLLVQKYYNPYQENCYIELWAKVRS